MPENMIASLASSFAATRNQEISLKNKEENMVSSLVFSSAVTLCSSTHKQVGRIKTRRPFTEMKRLNLQCGEPKNHLSFTGVPISALGDGDNEKLVSLENKIDEVSITTIWATIGMKLGALYKFTRPYSMYYNFVAILSMSLLPIQSLADFSPAFFYGLLKAMIASLLINIYTCGLNQITDVGIDKINKPTLPLASGEFSLADATAVTAISAMGGLLMGAWLNSPPLLFGLLASFFVATAYSVDLPLLRWKANTYLTAVHSIFHLGLKQPLFFFAHFQKYVLGRPVVYTKPVLFALVFMTFMAGINSVMKDLPDVEGDEAFGIKTPSSVYGKEVVFWSCVYLMLATYGGAAIFGATLPLLRNKIVTVLGHGTIAAVLWTLAKRVNINKPSETLTFYMFTWKLLYVEYFLILFAR